MDQRTQLHEMLPKFGPQRCCTCSRLLVVASAGVGAAEVVTWVVVGAGVVVVGTVDVVRSVVVVGAALDVDDALQSKESPGVASRWASEGPHQPVRSLQ